MYMGVHVILLGDINDGCLQKPVTELINPNKHKK